MPKMSEIINQIKSGQPINSVCIDSETITDEEMETFSKLLADSKTIQTLALGNNRHTVNGLKSLGNALTRNTSLTNLSIYSNEVVGEGWQAITHALSVNPSIQLKHLTL